MSKKQWTDVIFQKKHNPEIFWFYGSNKFRLINLILLFQKPNNAHNSINNGVRAVLTAFLDCQFCKAFLNLGYLGINSGLWAP